MPDQETFQAQFMAELNGLRQRVSQLEALKNGVSSTTISRPLSKTASSSITQPRIFVSIASYCDPDLPRTLNDCLANAQNPDRLRFGICWQYDVQHPVDLSTFQRDPRFRFVNYPIEESQGGTWARSIAQRFWDGEAYTLQVDSHMKFEPAWDETLIRMIQFLPSEKPLLTVNAPLFWYDAQGRLHRETELGIRTTRVNGWRAHEGWAPWFDWGIPNTRSLGHNRFISGNFVFTLGKWNTEVPQDPNHYYWGEEFNLTVRSFTHGYDFFLPQEIVVWHRMHPMPPRRHWEQGQDVVQAKNRTAYERLHWLLYSDEEGAHRQLGPYGPGHQRSIRDYEIYAGMNFKNKTAHPDVYTGNPPDPVTIKTEQDWEHCLTFEEYERLHARTTDMSVDSD